MHRLLLIALILFQLTSQGQDIRTHQIWNELLKNYVSEDGHVDYKGFSKERDQLDEYLNQLSHQAPNGRWSDSDKIAFWINVYNAFTVDLILDHYPIKSINDITNPWTGKIIKIGEDQLSLNDVENMFLRKDFDEVRIHFAINCASKSCPPLRNEAYTGQKLEKQLTEQTRQFINDPSYNVIQPKQLKLSMIFQWYEKDFIKDGTVQDFLLLHSDIPFDKNAEINYLNYDWRLNE